jgi:hypothetical protein
VFWEVPVRFWKFPGVLEVAEFWDPKTRFAILRLQKIQIQSKNS